MNKNLKIFLALILAIAIAPSVIYQVNARITTANSTDSWCDGKSGSEVCNDAGGNFLPTTDSAQTLGTTLLRWSTVFTDVLDVGTSVTLPAGSVSTADLADGAVTTEKLGSGSVTSDKIKDGEVYAADIQDANVTTAKLANGSVTTSKLHLEALDGFGGLLNLTNTGIHSFLGSLGIGTASPGKRLSIKESGLFVPAIGLGYSGGSEDTAFIGVTNSFDRLIMSGGVEPTADIGTDGTTADAWTARGTNTKGTAYVQSTADHKFLVSEGSLLNGNTTTMKLVLKITEEQRVGIGTASPVSNLQIAEGVATTAKMTLGDTDSAGCLMFRDNDEAGWTEVTFLNGAIQATTDADGICDGS